MDVENFLSVTNTTWGFIGITIGTINGLWQYANALCYSTTYVTRNEFVISGVGWSEQFVTIATDEIHNSQTNTCDCCFPCSITNIVCKAIATDDDSLTNIIKEDYKVISETLVSFNQNQGREEIAMNNLENQNSQQARRANTNTGTTLRDNTETPIINTNTLLGRIDLLKSMQKKIVKNPVRLLKGVSGIIAFPSLINSFIESNNNQAKIARIFTIGAPIFQEVGLNTLSVINYVTFNPALLIGSPQFIRYINGGLFPILYTMWGLAMAIASFYYSSKLTDPIEKFFLISIMTVRTFGITTNCRPLDFGSIFIAGINLWFAIQNLKWATGGINILDPNVALWKPF